MTLDGPSLASVTRVSPAAARERARREPRPTVSVVIPVFDHADRLEACLAALKRQTYPPELVDVVLVDNGCASSLEDLARRFPRVRVVHETAPGSYAARNRGVGVSEGRILAFTDADCVPAPNWIESGVEALASRPDASFVAGAIDVVFADPARPTAAELYESVASFRQQEYVRRWHFGATANLFVLRSVLKAVGPFDERLQSLGDREWGQRAWAAGFTPVYCAQATVAHPARRTLPALLRRTARMAGGFYALARARGWSLRQLVEESRLGVFPLECVAKATTARGVVVTARRLSIAAVALAIVCVRSLELVRLAVGGRPRRA